MKIHQILINDTNKLPDKFPEFHNICYEQIKKLYPNEEYHLYSGEDLKEMIKTNFDNEVYTSYLKLKPYSYRSDLARYCILYLYGGLYVDLNTRFINPIDKNYLEKFNFFAFRDMSGASIKDWSISTSIIFSKPKNKVIKKSIEIIIDNCKNEYYGIQSISPTGPIVLGKSVMYSNDELACVNGELICINSSMFHSPKKNMGFFTDFGEFIALRKPPEAFSGDIKTMGFLGTNNYVEMWKNKNVYDTTIKIL